MGMEMLFFGILPVVLYVLVDMKYGLKAGLYVAIASVIVVLSWLFWRTGEIDWFVLFDAALIVAMGFLSLKLQNPKFFKFQPAVIGAVLFTYMFACQIFSEPIFVHYIPMIVKLAPETEHIFSTPQAIEYFSMVSLHCTILVGVHAAACAYAALKWSNMKWMWTRLAIYPALVILAVVDQLFFGPLS